MAQMDRHQATPELRSADKCCESIGELIESAALGCDHEFFKSLTKHNDRVCNRGDPLKTGLLLDQLLSANASQLFRLLGCIILCKELFQFEIFWMTGGQGLFIMQAGQFLERGLLGGINNRQVVMGAWIIG